MPSVRSLPTNVLRSCADDGWRIPDVLWERIVPLLPRGNHTPWGVIGPASMIAEPWMPSSLCSGPDASGCAERDGICSSSSAHRRFQEWIEADVFVALWEQGLVDYDALQGIDWEWLAMDGAMTKAPLGGKKVGKNPTDRGKTGTKRSMLTDGRGVPIGLAVDGANRNDFKMARATIESIAVERPDPTPDTPQGLCLDKGYDYDEVRDLLDEFGFTAHIRARGKRPRRSSRRPVSKLGGGWWSARIVG